MAKNELMGVAPQNAAVSARGVSLTRPERTFLDALVSYVPHYEERLRDASSYTGDTHDSLADAASVTLDLDDPFGVIVPTDYIPKGRAKKPYEKKERRDDEELRRLGEKAGLREIDVNYIKGWVVYQGVHWNACACTGVDEDVEGTRVFRNPVVRKILNAASELGLCNGTTATKEEVADFYTQRMRSPILPDAVRDNAADKLARLLGYYPKENGSGQGVVNVQINCLNPYAKPVDAEVVE
jgi:hypothetical protein